MTLVEHYRVFAEKNGGFFQAKKTPPNMGFGSWLIFIITIPYKDGEIEFVLSESSPMKISYYFHSDLQLEFLIYPIDWLDRIGNLFKEKEFKTGNAVFDNHFKVYHNDMDFITNILDNKIQEYLLSINDEISNFRLNTEKSKSKWSILELNAPFDDTNLPKIEKTIEFLKYAVDNINCYLNKRIF